LADSCVAALTKLIAAGKDFKAAIGCETNADADAVRDAGAVTGVFIAAGIAYADTFVRAGGLWAAIFFKGYVYSVESFLKTAGIFNDLASRSLFTTCRQFFTRKSWPVIRTFCHSSIRGERAAVSGWSRSRGMHRQYVVSEHSADIDPHLVHCTDQRP
jgi:hypothetical protein